MYWCFGSHKSDKRIGHAVLVPEPESQRVQPSSSDTQTHSTAVVLPFIAPPSSPASFLQSDPSSVTQSPAGKLSLNSLSANSYSPRGPPSMFAIGPYAHETQLVTPPVFSAFTTEPSTAPFTPPPESVQLTTPSSPEVPFAQLLTSSLERARRNSGPTPKYGFSNYEFPHVYPGSPSPGAQLISPGSAVSYSGTSSPFPDRHPMLEFRTGEAPKHIGYEHFSTRKWGSRLGSGSLTPDGVGRGSRLGSGATTPDGIGLGSRLASGTVTPDGIGLGSRLGSGTATPDGGGVYSRDGVLLMNPVLEAAHLPLLQNGAKTHETMVDHRVSFELSGEDVARCLENKSLASNRTFLESVDDHGESGESLMRSEVRSRVGETSSNNSPSKPTSGEAEDEPCFRRQRSVTLGSIKEFNFDSSKGETVDKPTISSEWWANEAIAGKESKPANGWSFFPILQPEVS
ncbi:Uncharacterized protein At1g76660 [Linum perenne]